MSNKIDLSDFGAEDTLLSGSKKEPDQAGAAQDKGNAAIAQDLGSAGNGLFGSGQKGIPGVDFVERVTPGASFTTGTEKMWNQKPATYALQQERVEHRTIAFLRAEGRTTKEVAEIAGCSEAKVNYTIKQPWCDELIRQIIAERGGANVIKFLENKAMLAAEKLVDALDCDKDEAAATRVSVDAASKILDRIFGKPNQPITTHKGQDVKKLTDAELELLVTSSTGTSR